MQELLNQVIVIALAAIPVLFVADCTAKLHDALVTIPDVGISDDELIEALATVRASAKADRRMELERLSIRELKSLASQTGVPCYSRLTKAELVEILV